MAGPHPDDFASASLVALVVEAVIGDDPDLLPPNTVAPDPMRTATMPAPDKRALLQYIYDRRGAGPLLSVGRYLDKAAASPVLAVLAKAERPDILIDKWMRLERYGHATNRTDIRLDGERAIACRRYSQGRPPAAAENALIAGLLFGICGLAGARSRTLDIDDKLLDAGTLASAGVFEDNGEIFRISWADWEPPPSLPPAAEPGPAPLDRRLKTLLAADIARNWSIGEAASLVARSSRSLQRDLGAAGLTFSTTLRGARIDEAARLLRDDTVSLAEIGYCCGYADQPHFQRDFRRALNMSPGEYRRLSLA